MCQMEPHSRLQFSCAPLTADNYLDYLKSEIIRSAQIAKNAGADIPDSLGFKFTSEAGGMFAAPINGGMRPQMQGGQPPMGMRPMRGGRKQVGEYITDLDMQKYLNYVVSTQALKGVPAFDSKIEGINNGSGENEVFGDGTGSSVNFTDYTTQKNNTMLTDAIRQNVRLMNPMSFIGDGNTTIAPHWYIRHGARDRDTAFPVPLNFATKLQNAGKDVDFLMGYAAYLTPSVAMLVLGSVFVGIANGVGVPYLNTIASIKGGKNSATTVMPLLSAALYLGQFVSPIIVTSASRILFGQADLAGPYKVGIVLCLLFLVQVYFTRHFQSLPPNK